MWDEDLQPEWAAYCRMVCARCGPYYLSVTEDLDHRIVWSVGEGDVGEVDTIEGYAPDVEAAKRAALAEARRRLSLTWTALAELENETIS